MQTIPQLYTFDRQEYSSTGDMCLARVSVRFSTFLMASVYIHPNVSMTEITRFLGKYLKDYTIKTNELDTINEANRSIPMVVSGDFNVDISKNKTLLDYMKNEFGLVYLESPTTTLGNTHIDLTFLRHLDATTIPYVCYFSYHRPMMIKLLFQHH